ncbi:MAG: DoxX family protein [Acidobacteriota bacterium]
MDFKTTLLRTDDDLGPLIARLAAAIVMFPHGAQKALGWFGGGGFSKTMEGMTGMGLPSVIVFLVIVAEFLGPLALAAGFLSRAAAAGFVAVMVGAIVTVHGQHGFFMDWYGQQGAQGFEYHLLMIGLALVVMVRGGGAFSVDGRLVRS